MQGICPICKSLKLVEVYPYLGKSTAFLTKQIVECCQCRTHFINPFPSDEELSEYYSTYWNRHHISDIMPFFEMQAISRYEFMKPLFPQTRPLEILDVGAGFGLIRKSFTGDDQYDVVEVDPMALNYLRSIIKPRHIVEDIGKLTSKYDVIILAHILEHLKDPLSFLKEQQNRLKSNGIIFIEVPNKDFLYKKKNEPHLFFFDQDCLRYMIEKAGYKIHIDCSCGQKLQKLCDYSKLSDIQALYFITSFVKSFGKKIIPEFIIRAQKQRMFNRKPIEYGPNRQWARVVASRAD